MWKTELKVVYKLIKYTYGNKRYTIGKPVYVPLNIAIFVRNPETHLWVEQQS